MKRYFFCGVGGSGMTPLALFLIHQNHEVFGSDRSYDQGRTPEKFAQLAKAGVKLVSQDGSGINGGIDALVISSAVEPSIPDVAKALELKIPIIKRAELLAQIFNDARIGIAVAGTSGKSTVTGMIATILNEIGLEPDFINGGVVRNFESGHHVGGGDYFVTETDESDGSIALFDPGIAVLNNIELDHKTMDELNTLFGDFVARAKKGVALNIDNENVRNLRADISTPLITYGLENEAAELSAEKIRLSADHSVFNVQGINVKLNVPGRHNISNALAALSVANLLQLNPENAARALEKFTGIKRRFEIVGKKNDITVIDDFGHNPDKIRATLQTLKQFSGRLIVIFQPHGYGPLKLMGREIADVFGTILNKDDLLLMPDAFYAGGTADKSVTSKDVIEWSRNKGLNALYFEDRAEILEFISDHKKPGDRIIVMGARDDSLSELARQILKQI